MYKLIGFDPTTKGKFKTESGEELLYNNRLLKCITDNVGNGVVGWDICEFKIKLTDLASMLSCSADDNTVDLMLNSLLDSCFEPVYAIIKGKPTLNGLNFNVTVPETPIKSMSEVVTETRDKAKKGE